MNKRAVLYARVSSDDSKKDGRNLQGQLEMCREFAHENGYSVVAELAEDDRGASGASFELPKLNEALQMARIGEFDVLIARELDRFARSLAKQLIVEQEFKREGVTIEYVLGDYDGSPEGQLMKNVRAIIAEYEREKINERMTRARLNIVKKGSVMAHGQPPFGYRIAEEDTKRTFVINEKEARIVRLIFDLYIQGENRSEIVRTLNDMGIETWQDKNGQRSKRRARGRWSVSTVSMMLSNETYCGTWHYGKKTDVNGKRVLRPREEWLSVEVPAIMSRETWMTVQEIRNQNKKLAKRNRKYHYLLAGHIACAHCGLSLRGNASHGKKRLRLYYVCNSQGPETVRTCDLPRFRIEEVDASVWDWVRKKMSDPVELRKEMENRQAEQDRDNAPLRDRLSVVDSLIAENHSKLERMLDLYLSGDFAQEILIERKNHLETTLAALETERHNLAATLVARNLTDENIQSIEDFAKEVGQAFAAMDETDFEAKRAMIKWLKIQVRLAIENDERIAYISSPVLGKENSSVTYKPSRRAAPTPTAHPSLPVGA